jgi:hypothetical protein
LGPGPPRPEVSREPSLPPPPPPPEPFEFLDAAIAWWRGWFTAGRGKGSGAEVEMREWNVFLFQGGEVVSVHEYGDREDTLRAAGLAE